MRFQGSSQTTKGPCCGSPVAVRAGGFVGIWGYAPESKASKRETCIAKSGAESENRTHTGLLNPQDFKSYIGIFSYSPFFSKNTLFLGKNRSFFSIPSSRRSPPKTRMATCASSPVAVRNGGGL